MEELFDEVYTKNKQNIEVLANNKGLKEACKLLFYTAYNQGFEDSRDKMLKTVNNHYKKQRDENIKRYNDSISEMGKDEQTDKPN